MTGISSYGTAFLGSKFLISFAIMSLSTDNIFNGSVSFPVCLMSVMLLKNESVCAIFASSIKTSFPSKCYLGVLRTIFFNK